AGGQAAASEAGRPAVAEAHALGIRGASVVNGEGVGGGHPITGGEAVPAAPRAPTVTCTVKTVVRPPPMVTLRLQVTFWPIAEQSTPLAKLVPAGRVSVTVMPTASPEETHFVSVSV